MLNRIITECSDALCIITEYVQHDVMITIALFMRLNSVCRTSIVSNHLIWRFVARVSSCPICHQENICSRSAFSSIDDSHYWRMAAQCNVASNFIRRQWAIITTSRIMIKCSSSCASNYGDGREHEMMGNDRVCENVVSNLTPLTHGGCPKLPSHKKNPFDKNSRELPPRIRDRFDKKIFSFIRNTALKVLPRKQHRNPSPRGNDICSIAPKYVISNAEIHAMLDLFVVAESGVLLSRDYQFTHRHGGESDGILSIPKTTKTSGLCSSRSIGIFRKKKTLLRVDSWREVRIESECINSELPLLYPFDGEMSGLKSDMSQLVRNMYYAVGGGGENTAPVRWFCCTLRTPRIENPLPRSFIHREVLLAVCFSLPVVKASQSSVSCCSLLQTLDQHSKCECTFASPLFNPSIPLAARITAISRRSADFNWLQNNNYT